MQKDDELLGEIRQRFRDYMDASEYWRTIELVESYQMENGLGQWTAEDYKRQVDDDLPAITINKSGPVVDAIAGFEIQNRGVAKYFPRMSKEQQEGFSDVVSKAAAWIEQDSGLPMEKSQAFKDCLICGIGVTNTDIRYEENPDGEVEVRRFFPGFLLHDPSARRKNMMDADWLAEARVTKRKQVAEEFDISEEDAGASFFDDSDFLKYFDILQTRSDLTVVYEYQWRQREGFYRVNNPFGPYSEDTLVMNYMAIAMEKFSFNPADNIFNMSPKEYREFKEHLDALGVECEKPLKQKKYRYYRAIIAGGAIQEKAENFSQTGFSLKVMTGKFDEVNQCFYGVMRAIKPVQRLLNQSVSDYQGFLNTIPKGGVEIESDAVPDIQAFVDTYAKAKKVTIYNKGAISAGKVRPKIAPPIPQGLPEMIAFANNACMEVVGVTPDFMGIVDSKDMTSALYAQKVRQATTILADFFDAKRADAISQGRLNIDCVRVLAENSPGRLIRNVTGEGSEKYFPLLKDGVAAEYDIVVEESPQTPNERQDTFQKLMELSGTLLSKPQPVDITPLAIEYAPLPKDKLDVVRKAMIPPPPPEPDPRPGMLIESEAMLNQAQAEKTRADAKAKEMETLAKYQEIAQGTGEPAVDQVAMAELQLKQDELTLKREEIALKNRELNTRVMEQLLKNKQLASKERVDMARINASEQPELEAMDQMDESDAAEQEEKQAREAELAAREQAVQQQINQMHQMMQEIRLNDNAQLAGAMQDIAKAVTAQSKASTQMLTAINAMARELKKDDEPKEMRIEVIRDSKGRMQGAVRTTVN